MDKGFLKWAGGKSWFVKYHSNRIPHDFNRYIDPFLGGGALYFYLEPTNAILSDINQELITTYSAIKNDWQDVEKHLKKHAKKHNEQYYYYMRNMQPRLETTIAARMIYLNRTCFNGVYRVNKNGKFNVPIGTRNNILFDTDEFQARSQMLQNAQILCSDFEDIINLSNREDFLFCDPPYAVLDKNNRFLGYTKNMFDWNDQIRLKNALINAKNRNVKIIMTNVNHTIVKELYEDIDGFQIDEVTRYSSISGRVDGRQQYSELIISANI